MIKFNIKMLRLINDNMTQQKLIELTGIRQPTLSQYENNRTITIRVEHLNVLCQALNCQVGDLITFVPDDKNKATGS